LSLYVYLWQIFDHDFDFDDASQNKWENISERALDILIDHLNTLNDLTPKIRAEGRNGVDPSLIFGLDSKLFIEENSPGAKVNENHDEVETVTIYKGSSPPIHAHEHDSEGSHAHEQEKHINSESFGPLPQQLLKDALSKLSKESVWRVKGFVRTETGIQILNWAFGRYDLIEGINTEVMSSSDVVKLTVMGERGEVKKAGRKLAEALGASL
jgi:G3E family GTPase